MKKSLLLAALIALVIVVGGCSLKPASSTTTGSSATSTTLGGGSSGSTSTTLAGGSSGASGSSTTLATTPTTVAGGSAGASQTKRYQQSDAHLKYAGTWKTTSAAAASGGSFVFTDSSGSSVTIRFTGTHLAWIAKKSPVYGKAKVTLDGKSLGTIDLYSATTEWQQKVWGTGTLKSGSHTVTIAWTGLKRTAAKSADINIDAVEVTGTLS